MATHSSILAWEIPCKEEPGGLQVIESKTVGHDLVTKQAPPQKVLLSCPCFKVEYEFSFSAVLY